uniref:Uncharacterized protein n=1 Tax=Oreochromis niloticus TaxID=8128 RepID=A0A669DZP8_ORENI
FVSKMDDKIKKDLQQLLDKLWSEPDLKVTMKNSVKGGIKTTGCAVVGGLVGGPPGIAVGAAIGGIYSWKTSDDFKPLPQILREMPPAQLDELLKSVMVILGHLKWETVEGLIDYVMKDIPLKKAITDELKHRVKTLN